MRLCLFSAELVVEPESASKTILGKLVSDLQTGITVVNTVISGTLNYVTGYTEFSGDPAEQEGNFLAVKFTLPTGATDPTIQLIGGDHPNPVALDSDMNAVLRIKNTSEKLVVRCKINGTSCSETYTMTGLTLLPDTL